MKYLQDIAPVWNRKVRSGDLECTSKVNMSVTWECIVGEVHGWRYPTCEPCESFGLAFQHHSFAGEYSKRKPTPEFFKALDEFILHWNLRHRFRVKYLEIKHRFKSKHKGDIMVVHGSRFKPPERHAKTRWTKS